MGKIHHAMNGKINFLMVQLFNSYVTNYQRVSTTIDKKNTKYHWYVLGNLWLKIILKNLKTSMTIDLYLLVKWLTLYSMTIELICVDLWFELA